jgi:hypothetical protein
MLNFVSKPLFAHTDFFWIKIKLIEFWGKWNIKIFRFDEWTIDLSDPGMEHDLFRSSKMAKPLVGVFYQ